MSDEQGYNGWKNYETWAVGMYLDGNYTGAETYHRTIEIVTDCDPAEESGRRYLVADALKELMQDETDIGSSVGLAADLLGAAFSRVDWYELADAWIEAVAEEEEEGGGITAEGQELGHRYTMGNVNAYCPQCSKEHSAREGQDITVLDCDYDLDK